LLYSTQQEADRARTKANLEHFALVEARSTIMILARDRKSLRRQHDERDHTIDELKANVAELTEYIESLESHLDEEEGIDLRKEDNALILFIATSLHKPMVMFTEFSFRLGTSEV
jgi:hypothetical protein